MSDAHPSHPSSTAADPSFVLGSVPRLMQITPPILPRFVTVASRAEALPIDRPLVATVLWSAACLAIGARRFGREDP